MERTIDKEDFREKKKSGFGFLSLLPREKEKAHIKKKMENYTLDLRVAFGIKTQRSQIVILFVIVCTTNPL